MASSTRSLPASTSRAPRRRCSSPHSPSHSLLSPLLRAPASSRLVLHTGAQRFPQHPQDQVCIGEADTLRQCLQPVPDRIGMYTHDLGRAGARKPFGLISVEDFFAIFSGADRAVALPPRI